MTVELLAGKGLLIRKQSSMILFFTNEMAPPLSSFISLDLELFHLAEMFI